MIINIVKIMEYFAREQITTEEFIENFVEQRSFDKYAEKFVQYQGIINELVSELVEPENEFSDYYVFTSKFDKGGPLREIKTEIETVFDYHRGCSYPVEPDGIEETYRNVLKEYENVAEFDEVIYSFKEEEYRIFTSTFDEEGLLSEIKLYLRKIYDDPQSGWIITKPNDKKVISYVIKPDDLSFLN